MEKRVRYISFTFRDKTRMHFYLEDESCEYRARDSECYGEVVFLGWCTLMALDTE